MKKYTIWLIASRAYGSYDTLAEAQTALYEARRWFPASSPWIALTDDSSLHAR